MDREFFDQPPFEALQQLEAVRGVVVDGLTQQQAAERYGYTRNYMRLLLHQFRHNQLPWQSPAFWSALPTWSDSGILTRRIQTLRQQGLAAREIMTRLHAEGHNVSMSTIQRMLKEAGFPKLQRRSRRQILSAKLGLDQADRTPEIQVADHSSQVDFGGLPLFIPFLSQLGIKELIRQADWPLADSDFPEQVLLLALAAKLSGRGGVLWIENTGPGRLGRLFAGLSADAPLAPMVRFLELLDLAKIDHFHHLLGERLAQMRIIGRTQVASLTTKSLPYSYPANHQPPPVNPAAKAILITDLNWPNIFLEARSGAASEDLSRLVGQICSGSGPAWRGQDLCLIFDPKILSHEDLACLAQAGVCFITPRRRGENMKAEVRAIGDWQTVVDPPANMNYAGLRLAEQLIRLQGSPFPMRQITITWDKKELPIILMTNDSRSSQQILHDYSRHLGLRLIGLRVLDFFPPCGSEAIPIAPALDLALTQAAQALYYLLATRLPSFHQCDRYEIFEKVIRRPARLLHDGQQHWAEVDFGELAPHVRESDLLAGRLVGNSGNKLAIRLSKGLDDK